MNNNMISDLSNVYRRKIPITRWVFSIILLYFVSRAYEANIQSFFFGFIHFAFMMEVIHFTLVANKKIALNLILNNKIKKNEPNLIPFIYICSTIESLGLILITLPTGGLFESNYLPMGVFGLVFTTCIYGIELCYTDDRAERDVKMIVQANSEHNRKYGRNYNHDSVFRDSHPIDEPGFFARRKIAKSMKKDVPKIKKLKWRNSKNYKDDLVNIEYIAQALQRLEVTRLYPLGDLTRALSTTKQSSLYEIQIAKCLPALKELIDTLQINPNNSETRNLIDETLILINDANKKSFSNENEIADMKQYLEGIRKEINE